MAKYIKIEGIIETQDGDFDSISEAFIKFIEDNNSLFSGITIEVDENGNNIKQIDNPCCNITNINPHTCPYKEEINFDSESLCTCCEECTHQCTMDI